jgi:adenylate kinase
MLEVMENYLSHPSSTMKECGWTLDGYPRTLQQASDLDHLLHKINQPLHRVFHIRVSEQDLYDRIKG